jgi:hypothetical protein
MKIFVFAFFLLLISCGQNDRAKLHADSIERQLIKLPVSEKELEYLVDSSKLIYNARLKKTGVFYDWDFGMSEATHRFYIDSSYIGNDSGEVDVEQRLTRAYLSGHQDYYKNAMHSGDKFILFLRSTEYPPPVPPPVIDSSGNSCSYQYLDYAMICELTIDTTGIMPWSEDIEIRVGQLIKAKQKH